MEPTMEERREMAFQALQGLMNEDDYHKHGQTDEGILNWAYRKITESRQALLERAAVAALPAVILGTLENLHDQGAIDEIARSLGFSGETTLDKLIARAAEAYAHALVRRLRGE